MERCGVRKERAGERRRKGAWTGERAGGRKREGGSKKFVLVIISVAEESNEGRQVMNHWEVPF